jgi:hypothetical protein
MLLETLESESDRYGGAAQRDLSKYEEGNASQYRQSSSRL